MFTFKNLHKLVFSMKCHRKTIEQFYFKFNNVEFDCILDIGVRPFELMLGVKSYNFACVLKIERGYRTELPSDKYFELCKILHLTYKDNLFSSPFFLRQIDIHIPEECTDNLVNPSHLVPFRKDKLSNSDKADGFIFCGWLAHKGKNNGHARNFEKTEFLLGKDIANFCRINDISSKWTNDEKDSSRITKPPGMD